MSYPSPTEQERHWLEITRPEADSYLNANDDGVHYLRDIRTKLVSCAIVHAQLDLDARSKQVDIDPFDVYVESNYGIKLYYAEDGNFFAIL